MKQHPLCTDTEHEPDVMNLAVPAALEAGVGSAADRGAISSGAPARCWDGRPWQACWAIAHFVRMLQEIVIRQQKEIRRFRRRNR